MMKCIRNIYNVFKNKMFCIIRSILSKIEKKNLNKLTTKKVQICYAKYLCLIQII